MKRPITLLILLGVSSSGSVRAQEASGVSMTITPSVGMAVILGDGDLWSGGMTTLLEIDLTRLRWRWSLFAAASGIGVGCSDGCELGGESVGGGISYRFGGFAVGGGLGGLHRSTGWHVQPHGLLSFDRGVFRAQLRVELPERTDGAHAPILVGFRIPVR